MAAPDERGHIFARLGHYRRLWSIDARLAIPYPGDVPTRRSKGPARPAKVALLFEVTNAYARSLLGGIGKYILSHGPWSVHYAEVGPNEDPPPWLSGWNGDGAIVRGENPRLARAVERLAGPVVDLTPSRLLRRAPWVKSDDAAIAELAARHFLERGFRNFAFCGDSRFAWSARRGERFVRLVQEAGFCCALYEPGRILSSGDAEVDGIGAWLLQLQKPMAVFACYDNRGQQLLEACRRVGLSVPEEVAVLGVDNDEVLCMLSPPPLSSIILNPERTGWEAAALLAALMEGRNPPSQPLLIPPVGIRIRQSTDILAVADAKIAAALKYIREHACESIGVTDVLRQTPMARRSLEMRFERLLHRSPLAEILRVRLNRVRELLVGTELPIWEIAGRAGFDPEYMSVVFKREAGMSPREYRRAYGLNPPAQG